MPFCTNCGNELADEDRFCNTCGFECERTNTPSDQTANEKRNVNIIFYLALSVMFLFWLYLGMPIDRFWWR